MAQKRTGMICTGNANLPAWTWDNEREAQACGSNSSQKSAQDYEAQPTEESDPIAQAIKYAQRTGKNLKVTVTKTVTETIKFE